MMLLAVSFVRAAVDWPLWLLMIGFGACLLGLAWIAKTPEVWQQKRQDETDKDR